MASYTLRQTVETTATDRASTTNTAKTEAAAFVAEAITAAGGEHLVSVDAEAPEIYEFPSAPFEPYRVTVRADVVVTADADGESDALDRGRDRLAEILAASDLDGWEYVGSGQVEAPV